TRRQGEGETRRRRGGSVAYFLLVSLSPLLLVCVDARLVILKSQREPRSTNRSTMLLAAITLENVAHPWAWWLVVFAGPGWLYYTYRWIFERTERRLVWGLMALRGAGLLALLLALSKPTWTREKVETNAGHVGLVVDNSVSMSLPDRSGKSRYALAVAAARYL